MLALQATVAAHAQRSAHVAVTSFSTPSELAGLHWNTITHLHQAINPLVVSAAGEVAPLTASSWPEVSLVSAAHGNLSRILVPIHMESKQAADTFLAKSTSEIENSARRAAAAALAAGYDGISIDIEGLKPPSKDGLETFVTACATALRTAVVPPRMLVVTLYIAKLYQPHVPSAYNLTKLALLADRVLLMGYDMTWYGAKPGTGAHEAGPNSPLDGLASALTTAVTVLGAAPEALLLGLPLYGRLYDCDGDSPATFGNCSCATNCKRDKGSALLMAAGTGPGCVEGWEMTAATPFFDCSFGSNVSGGQPTHVRQQGWFENGRSLRAKLQLASERGVAGVSMWSAHGCPHINPSCSAVWAEISAYMKQGKGHPTRERQALSSSPSPPPALPSGQLYGLTRVRNSPSCSGAPSGCTQLVSIDSTTGALKNIGAGHTALAAVGDLAVLDAHGEIFYYLGDGLNGTGTVLVGISIHSGEATCYAPVAPIHKQVGAVGGEQSLSIDAARHRLLVSGPVPDDASGHYHHQVFSAALNGVLCPGPFTPLTAFGYADYEPIAHGTGFDAVGGRLFVAVSTGVQTGAIAVVPISGAPTELVPMHGGTYCMWGPNWQPRDRLLYGVGTRADGQGIDWRSLDPTKGAWTSRPLQFSGNASFSTLWGNLGSVRAFDAATSALYVLMAQGRSETLHLARIDTASGTVTSHAALHGDLGWSSEVLLAMTLS